MNTLNESGLRKLDIDLINFFFKAKASSLEELVDHRSGMFSTQQKLMELKGQLLDFLQSYKNKNSIFYIFFNEESEVGLKIIVNNLVDEPDDRTKRFAIIVDEDLIDFKVQQLSLSSKILTIIDR
jgi:hypothetical protein